MDPNTGRIYAEDEIEGLPPEIQDRLIHGSKEELEALQKHMIQKEAEELGELLEDMDEVLSMDDPKPNEKFYPINRAARRAAEKHERKQRFVNKPGKVRDRGTGR
jgi:hypothetical protein